MSIIVELVRSSRPQANYVQVYGCEEGMPQKTSELNLEQQKVIFVSERFFEVELSRVLQSEERSVHNIITQCWKGVIQTMHAYCSSHHSHYFSYLSPVSTHLSHFSKPFAGPFWIFLVLSTCRIQFLFTCSPTRVILVQCQTTVYFASVGNFEAWVIMLCWVLTHTMQ
jgi:hypothetical protein